MSMASFIPFIPYTQFVIFPQASTAMLFTFASALTLTMFQHPFLEKEILQNQHSSAVGYRKFVNFPTAKELKMPWHFSYAVLKISTFLNEFCTL